MKNGYEDIEVCKSCGGACCRSTGCSLAPEDMLREISEWKKEHEDEVYKDEAYKDKERIDKKQVDKVDVDLKCEYVERGYEQSSTIPPSKSQIEAWLQESHCAIDSFTGDTGPCYYIRMRHKCFTFIGVDAMGECIALTEQGCSLSFEKRPKGGRYLEGRADRHCQQHYTREQMIEDWRPYQQMLREIWDIWHDRLEKEGVFDRCEEEYMHYQMEKRKRERNRE